MKVLKRVIGKCDVILNDEYYDYVGEVDSKGKACGHGVATKFDDPDFKYIGTFIDDKPEGIGKFRSKINIWCRC